MKNLIKSMVLMAFAFTSYNTMLGQFAGLDEQSADAIIYMLEEEKVAKDVYNFFEEKYGNQIFVNISAAEERHESMVEMLAVDNHLIKAGEWDGSEAGVFQNKDLQELYNSLVKEGEVSLVAALQVGVKIEELNISDLEKSISETQDAASIKVYTQLKEASERHLNAFNRNLERQGIDSATKGKNAQNAKSKNACKEEGKACCSSKDKKGKGKCKGSSEKGKCKSGK